MLTAVKGVDWVGMSSSGSGLGTVLCCVVAMTFVASSDAPVLAMPSLDRVE